MLRTEFPAVNFFLAYPLEYTPAEDEDKVSGCASEQWGREWRGVTPKRPNESDELKLC